MDEKKISDILHTLDIPEADDNARKRALNMALAEFETTKKKNEKSSQGISLLSRLMGINNSNPRRETMEQTQKRKLIYGGMATAMAVVLIAGVSFTQLQDGILEEQASTATLIAAPYSNEGGSPQYLATAQDSNQHRAEVAPQQAIPIPSTPPTGRISSQDNHNPMQRWRSLQGERLTKSESLSSNASKNSLVDTTPFGTMPQRTADETKSDDIFNLNDASNSEPQSEQDVIIEQAINKLWEDDPQKAKKLYTMQAPLFDFEKSPEAIAWEREQLDKFEKFKINPVKIAAEEPVSTFSVDVDTASYSFVRRQLNHGMMPGSDAVRVEELINYFDYNYAVPENKETPFKASITITPSPWAKGKELLHIGIKGYEIENAAQPRSNLVFLLDTSGSMNAQDKLPLLKSSLKMLLDTLKPDDTISIATYAGSAGVALEPTKVSDKAKIIAALDNLQAGGGTAGAQGIELAYSLAEQNFDKDAVNRVILATDGDFNIGIHDPEQLEEYVEKKRKSGVFLSVLGFGQGNYNDHIMQSLAQNGNGTAAYIDTLNEAQKVLVEEAAASLFTIAKDVKIQIEFNPDLISEYRLVGYETRALAREDFNNDKVDAGDIGAGHTVTAIYEITPKGSGAESVDPLRYGAAAAKAEKTEDATAKTDFGGEYAFLKMRYKLPNEDTSKLITTPITSAMKGEGNADTKFATAVAAFGQILKGGQYTGDYSYDDVNALAQEGKGEDKFGYRAEFMNLVRLAKSLDQK